MSNITDSDSAFSFRLRNGSGSPLAMPIGDTLASGSGNITLGPHESVTVSTNAENPARTGWIDLAFHPDDSIVASATVWSASGVTTIEPTPMYHEAWVNSGVSSSVQEQLVLVNPSATTSEVVLITFRGGSGTTCRTAWAIAPLGQTLVNVGDALSCALATDGYGHYRLRGNNGFSGLLLAKDSQLGFSVRNFVALSHQAVPIGAGPSFGSATIENRTYRVGTAIAATILPAGSGGLGTLEYSLSPSVPGLTFDSLTRRLQGAPSSAGEYRMTYTATDVRGRFASLSFVVTVNGSPGQGIVPR